LITEEDDVTGNCPSETLFPEPLFDLFVVTFKEQQTAVVIQSKKSKIIPKRLK
jgi:hypothetical protein